MALCNRSIWVELYGCECFVPYSTCGPAGIVCFWVILAWFCHVSGIYYNVSMREIADILICFWWVRGLLGTPLCWGADTVCLICKYVCSLLTRKWASLKWAFHGLKVLPMYPNFLPLSLTRLERLRTPCHCCVHHRPLSILQSFQNLLPPFVTGKGDVLSADRIVPGQPQREPTGFVVTPVLFPFRNACAFLPWWPPEVTSPARRSFMGTKG